MKVLLGLGLLSLSSALAPNPELNNRWEDFKKNFGKSYVDSAEEHSRRLIFEQNHRLIEDHNAREGKSFTMGINKFSDLTNAEYRDRMLSSRGIRRQRGSGLKFERATQAVPDFFDWRTEGYVTPVKDQEDCGSCWAFSATGSLEGQHFKSTGKLVSLSEQNLVDCSDANGGCSGGWVDEAFAYILKQGGIDTESSYPYEGTNGTCAFDKMTIGAKLKAWRYIKSKDEEALRQAVGTIGPISISLDASGFQFYASGILDVPSCSEDELDHAALVVGYGMTRSGEEYWLVKNSWGHEWGEEGYVRMSRNKNNQCGIATDALYPIV